jgi:hypothetical protein
MPVTSATSGFLFRSCSVWYSNKIATAPTRTDLSRPLYSLTTCANDQHRTRPGSSMPSIPGQHPTEWLPRSHSAVHGWQGGGEEVGEQLRDALSLVVMDPVRCVGQPLDPVEIGHIVMVRLG